MPPPCSFVAGGLPGSASLSPLDDDDDDDDICPVCDGECTCRTRAGPSTFSRPAPSAPSTSFPSSSLSQKQRQPQPSAPYPLKIKLTVPPNLKFHKFGVASSSSEPRRPPTKGVPKLKAKYPTFIPAGSTSSHTSSPESSDFDSDDAFGSSDDDDERFVPRSHHGKGRPKKQPLGDDSGQKRRDHTLHNRWELKPRKMSVGPEAADSEDTSAEDEGADDEDDGNEEDDEAEADVEADTFAELEEDPTTDEVDGKLGVSFGGVPSGWSEDDEESSFDADIFFANLDESSDSCSSPSALRNDAFASDFETDADVSFSADEEDALLLMNVDPTVQIRRTTGEFEVGVELDGLSFGWDGQLVLPAPLHAMNSLDLGLLNGSTESDVDMTASDGGSTTEDQVVRWSDDGILDETDGETTEDELVDSDGLPNPRAMKLFRWPPAVSAIDPASTLSQTCTSSAGVLTSASRTTRFALATISAQRGPPAPTPADILAGKISLDDLDNIEINNGHHLFEETSSSTSSSRRVQSAPHMGQFIAEAGHVQRRAVIDGSGQVIPSPFPSRIRRVKPRSALARTSINNHELSTDAESHTHPLSQGHRGVSVVSIQRASYDDPGTQSQVPTSEDPSSTDAIDLDDVLDASFMDSEPILSDSEIPLQETWVEPKALDRWDRIPVATFRRTRESSLMEGTASDPGLSGKYTSIGAFVNNDMLGTPKIRGGRTKGSVRRAKSHKNLLVISPVLLPVPDGDCTPTGGSSPMYNPFHRQQHSYQEKSRKELRKEKAMMKRKMVGKNIYSSQKHHHHRHHPNTKTRGTNSMQRTHSSASNSHVPRLNL